jgi:hypothetical protein
MKIRIKGNSVRLRLTRSEITAFGTQALIEEKTVIGNNIFLYQLKSFEENDMKAEFDNNTLSVLMPKEWKEEWIHTERVGFEANMPLPNGESLYLLVEKDFVCLDQTTEDQSDNYPNPLADVRP